MTDISRSHALELDKQDPLASFRDRFIISDPELLYLDGNSLGRLPKAAIERARQLVESEWGDDLIRGWNKGWWEAPARVGDKIGKLIGAAPGQVVVSDTTSMNLYKLVMAALTHLPDRKRIISDAMNFPSDLYILQGCANTFGNRHEIVVIGSQDGELTPDLAALESAINEDTALVTLSHVLFKSGYLYDMRAITDLAHSKGALVLWDLSHSAGSVPVQLDACNVDLAIGCTYKYLNGGPGAPAFLYVNKRIQEKLTSPIWGWWGQNKPFDFGLQFEPAPGVDRFLVGTQPMLSMLTMESALEPLLDAGMDSLRRKSIALTGYLIALADEILVPLGFRIGSPREADRRGSHVSLRHADAYRINRALIEEMKVIPDFRAPDNIRLGLAPLYNSFTEVWDMVDRTRRVIVEKRHEKYPQTRLTVT